MPEYLLAEHSREQGNVNEATPSHMNRQLDLRTIRAIAKEGVCEKITAVLGG
jgi:hypothetical protein